MSLLIFAVWLVFSLGLCGLGYMLGRPIQSARGSGMLAIGGFVAILAHSLITPGPSLLFFVASSGMLFIVGLMVGALMPRA